MDRMSAPRLDPDKHIISELGLSVVSTGTEMIGTAKIQPELHVPGTTCLRTSALALWADVVCGMVAALHTAPRVPVTLDLSLDLVAPPTDVEFVRLIGRMVKAGRSAITTEFTIVDGHDELIGHGGAAFMIAPDVSLMLPDNAETLQSMAARVPRLQQPYAQRANCERLQPGVASPPHTDETGNAAGTLQGGLLALVAEEAVLSIAPPESTPLVSLDLRYLLAWARVGPAIATAELHGALARVEVRDGGSNDRLCVLATGRTVQLRGAPAR